MPAKLKASHRRQSQKSQGEMTVAWTRKGGWVSGFAVIRRQD